MRPNKGMRKAARIAELTCLKISFCVSCGRSRIDSFRLVSDEVGESEVGRTVVDGSLAGASNGAIPIMSRVRCHTSSLWKLVMGVTPLLREVLLGSAGIVGKNKSGRPLSKLFDFPPPDTKKSVGRLFAGSGGARRGEGE